MVARRLWRVFGLVLVVLAFWMRVLIAQKRSFDPDELQHLHTGYCIGRGLLPYRDFYEHHTPWLPWLLSWFLGLFGTTTETLFHARYLMVALTLGVVAATHSLARQLFDRDVAIVAAVLLSYSLPFLEKTLEVRPDVPAVLCLMAGLGVTVRALRGERARTYLLAGGILGAALLFTQKTVFGLLGAFVIVACHALLRPGSTGGRRWKSVGVFALGLALPLVATALFFWTRGGLSEFVEFNFSMNARWKAEFSALIYTSHIFRQDPFLAVLGCCGCALVLLEVLLLRERRWEHALLVAVTCATLLGLLYIPVPYLQSFVPLFPLASLFAAFLLKRLVELPGPRALAEMWNEPRRRRALLLSCLAFAGIVVALGFGLEHSRPRLRGDGPRYLVAWGLLAASALFTRLPRRSVRALCLCALFAAGWFGTSLSVLGISYLVPAAGLVLLAGFGRPHNLRLSLLLVGLIAFPSQVMVRQSRKVSNADQIAAIEYVLSNTTEQDSVFSGWTGSGVFRPHAYFYPFLHWELQLMLTPEQRGTDIVRVLQARPPKLVEFDDSVRGLEPVLKQYLRANYQATGVGALWEPIPRGEER